MGNRLNFHKGIYDLYTRILLKSQLLYHVVRVGLLLLELHNKQSECQPEYINPGAGVNNNPWVLTTVYLLIIGRKILGDTDLSIRIW